MQNGRRYWALSVLQPWATLIASGKKRIETRSWPTDYRGEILIHAAKRWTRAQWEIASGRLHNKVVAACLNEAGLVVTKNGASLPLGAIVARAKLIGCRPVAEMAITRREWWLGDFTGERFAWLLEDVSAVEPFPARGGHGIFQIMLPIGSLRPLARRC